jgi:hypothetical protein
MCFTILKHEKDKHVCTVHGEERPWAHGQLVMAGDLERSEGGELRAARGPETETDP